MRKGLTIGLMTLTMAAMSTGAFAQDAGGGRPIKTMCMPSEPAVITDYQIEERNAEIATSSQEIEQNQ